MYLKNLTKRLILKHRFLDPWNGISIICSNTVFYVYLRYLVRNRGKFSLFIQNIAHQSSLPTRSFLRKYTVLQHLVFIGFYITKNVSLVLISINMILGITEEKKVSILDNFLDLGRNTLPDNLFQAAFLTVSRIIISHTK